MVCRDYKKGIEIFESFSNNTIYEQPEYYVYKHCSLPAEDFGVPHLQEKKVDAELNTCLGQMEPPVAEMKSQTKSHIGVSRANVCLKLKEILSKEWTANGVNGMGKL